MGGSEVEGTATSAPSGLTDVLRAERALLAQLQREQYDEHAVHGSQTDPYAVARELGYRKGWNDRARALIREDADRRTVAALRELRDSTFAPGVLFEAVSVEGEWEP